MKYLLVSDIHGCRPALEKVLKFYDEQHCDMLCILGDILNYGPRNSIPEGLDECKKLFLTHGHIYNKENMPKGKFDAVVYGHTHLWEITPEAGTVICNTGSITFPKGGNVATFMTYEGGTFTAYDMEGCVLKQYTL